MHGKKEFVKLASDFRGCRDVLIALGDENRLHLLYQMMVAENPMGIRVGEITKRTNLSRPAVSHHLKLLRDAGIVKAGISLGAIFSIHADSYRKKATREALALIPAECLRFETDADETFVASHGLKDSDSPKDVAKALERAGHLCELLYYPEGKQLGHAFPSLNPSLPESGEVLEKLVAWFDALK